MSSASGFLYLREREQIIPSVNQCSERSFSQFFFLEVKYRNRVSIECQGKKIDEITQPIAEAESDK